MSHVARIVRHQVEWNDAGTEKDIFRSRLRWCGLLLSEIFFQSDATASVAPVLTADLGIIILLVLQMTEPAAMTTLCQSIVQMQPRILLHSCGGLLQKIVEHAALVSALSLGVELSKSDRYWDWRCSAWHTYHYVKEIATTCTLHTEVCRRSSST